MGSCTLGIDPFAREVLFGFLLSAPLDNDFEFGAKLEIA